MSGDGFANIGGSVLAISDSNNGKAVLHLDIIKSLALSNNDAPASARLFAVLAALFATFEIIFDVTFTKSNSLYSASIFAASICFFISISVCLATFAAANKSLSKPPNPAVAATADFFAVSTIGPNGFIAL